MNTPEHPPPVHLAVAGQGSPLATHLPEEVGEQLASLSLSQQLLSKYIRCSRQMHEGLDVSPMTLCRQKATSSVPAGPVHLPGVNQLHTHWTCFGCECFSISAVFLLGAAASPGTPWAPRKAFQRGLSAGFIRLDFLCPFSLVLQRGRAVSHVSLGLFVKDNPPY